jgi:tRNA threonylcarbamoyladenosine biosynthesis protein TsaB
LPSPSRAGKARSAQTLAPAIVRLLAEQRIEAQQIGLVATTVGPGSFTGLRVGVTAAKTFAYAVGAQVLGISTLDALAHGVPQSLLAGVPPEMHVVLDAQRRELFWGRFGGDLTRLEPDRLVPAEEWLSGLRPGTVVTGAGLARPLDRLPAGVVATTPDVWEPSAAVVGQLAWREFQAGRRDDLWKLAPVYLRPSYAEEKK